MAVLALSGALAPSQRSMSSSRAKRPVALRPTNGDVAAVDATVLRIPYGEFWKRCKVRRQARLLLTSLGETVDEIAHHLRDVGARGVPNDPFECVLSTYLASVISTSMDVDEIVVGRYNKWTGRIQTLIRLSLCPKSVVRVDIEEHVYQFLLAFDAGNYPELVRDDGPLKSKVARIAREAASSSR
jgi:hypothetical protein